MWSKRIKQTHICTSLLYSKCKDCRIKKNNLLMAITFHICTQKSVHVFLVNKTELGVKILFVCLMVFNITFNNILVISWRSVLLVEETRGPRENH